MSKQQIGNVAIITFIFSLVYLFLFIELQTFWMAFMFMLNSMAALAFARKYEDDKWY